MSRICKECPIAQTAEQDLTHYAESIENGVLLNVIQGLSALGMRKAVEGTVAGLTEERIEGIRQDSIKRWGDKEVPGSEGNFLDQHPEIAKAVHDCELKIARGECVIHSV